VEQVRRQRYVGGARDADGLAVVERLDRGQLVGVLQDRVADPVDHPAALRRGHAAPLGVL
jgi:hypothetical protein